jgi:hypothetical protein
MSGDSSIHTSDKKILLLMIGFFSIILKVKETIMFCKHLKLNCFSNALKTSKCSLVNDETDIVMNKEKYNLKEN